jgi:hypothetical protein
MELHVDYPLPPILIVAGRQRRLARGFTAGALRD